MMHINHDIRFGKFTEHWHPYIIGELNDTFVKIAKVKGEFVWHHHEFEDEMFVVSGRNTNDRLSWTKTCRPGPEKFLLFLKAWNTDEKYPTHRRQEI